MQHDLFDRTWRVSELGEEIKLFLGEAFDDVWVSGEVQRFTTSRRGHAYFDLVEKGRTDDIVGRIDAVIWRTAAQRVNRDLANAGQSLADGVTIRCRGRVDFYPPGGRLQLVVQEVDPVFTLGLLARQRRETLAALAARALLDRNAELRLSPVPLSVGLVTSHGSAAYHDFVSTLEESPFGFRVVFVHAAVQGPAAEREVSAAIRSAARLGVDVIAVVRGGGAKADLVAFDALSVAEAIAISPVPVLTGLGHEIDDAVADRVAHTSVKTPTMAAAVLVRRVEEAEARLYDAGDALRRGATTILGRRREQLGQARVGLERVRRRLDRERARITSTASLLSRLAGRAVRREAERLVAMVPRLVEAPDRRLERGRLDRNALANRLVVSARRQLELETERCSGLDRLCRQLSPRRTLERGFSLTRDTEGRLIRRPDQATVGEILVTELAKGALRSRVEEA